MNTENLNPPNKYSIYASTSSFKTLTNAVWINPHPSKANTPVANGGLVLSNFIGKTSLPAFDITFPSTGKTEKVHGSDRVEILPVYLTPVYSVVSKGDLAVCVRRPVFARQDEWPEGVSVSSATTMFFVLKEDEDNNLCAVTFRSHLAASITQQFNLRGRAVAATGRRLVGVALEIFALPSLLSAGKARAVGKKQVGYVADPILSGENYTTVEQLDAALIDQVRFAELLDIAHDKHVVSYPFNPLSRRQYVEEYEDALRALTGSAPAPAPAPAPQVLPAAQPTQARVLPASEIDFPF